MSDLLICSNTAEEHLNHVRLVLEQLKENKLYVFPEKCFLLQEGVEAFGLLNGKKRIRADP